MSFLFNSSGKRKKTESWLCRTWSEVGMRFDFRNLSRGSKEIGGTDSFTAAHIFAGGVKVTYIISKYL